MFVDDSNCKVAVVEDHSLSECQNEVTNQGSPCVDNIDTGLGLLNETMVNEIYEEGANPTPIDGVSDYGGFISDCCVAESLACWSYIPTVFHEELCHFPVPDVNNHTIGGCKSQMNASSWLAELKFENDNWLKSYIYRGITKSFAIVDDDSVITSYDCPNYRSVYESPARNFVSSLMSLNYLRKNIW